tara:strand:+ start:141 stop:788 length:648 start_codon:yes stop_codon:yes gene_type:complete
MEVTSWLQIVLACFLGAVSPGPSLALVVGNTSAQGRIYGVATSLGHATGIGLWAVLTAVGLAEVIVETSGLLVGVQSLGACLIAYIGFRTLIAGDGLSVTQIDTSPNPPRMVLRAAGEGFLISLLNPKIALFFLAIFSHFVHSDVGWIQTGLMGTTAWVIDAGWYITVALTLTSTGMMRILEDRALVISRISGSFLVLLALYLLGGMVQYLLREF